jgi:CRISPR-associated protein Cas2
MAANGWRIVWVLAVYDCPTLTREERHDYMAFHKRLLKEGFIQHQLSVYLRHCPTLANAEALVTRLKGDIPDSARVSFFFLTDKQYGMTREFVGPKSGKSRPDEPEQFELF